METFDSESLTRLSGAGLGLLSQAQRITLERGRGQQNYSCQRCQSCLPRSWEIHVRPRYRLQKAAISVDTATGVPVVAPPLA
jgi:hypothetical protein